MNPGFFPILNADSAVVALLADGGGGLRVFRDEAPPEVRAPFVIWRVAGGRPEQYLGEGPGINASRIQFDTYANDQATADAAGRAIRNALAMDGYVESYNGTGRDEETRHFFTSFDMSFLTDQF